MLKVTNGSMTFTVTRGAYSNYYKHKGFHVVGVAGAAKNTGVDTTPGGEENADLSDSPQFIEEDGEEYDEAYDGESEEDSEELSEIPLSEMSFSQLCEYAEQLDLDYSGIRSKRELRLLIKEHIK